uniref:Uncharacterized protein n=1 Tax=Ditylenchus dipsaci TaxID=166011 RepID=A0A915DX78_9BILA
MELTLDDTSRSRRTDGIDYEKVVKFNGSEAEDDLEAWKKSQGSLWMKQKWEPKGRKRLEKHSIENFVCAYSTRKLYSCSAVLRIRRPSTTLEVIVEKAKTIQITKPLLNNRCRHQ